MSTPDVDEYPLVPYKYVHDFSWASPIKHAPSQWYFAPLPVRVDTIACHCHVDPCHSQRFGHPHGKVHGPISHRCSTHHTSMVSSNDCQGLRNKLEISSAPNFLQSPCHLKNNTQSFKIYYLLTRLTPVWPNPTTPSHCWSPYLFRCHLLRLTDWLLRIYSTSVLQAVAFLSHCIFEKGPFSPTKTRPRDCPHPCVMALMGFLLCRNKALQVRRWPPKALRCKGMSPAQDNPEWFSVQVQIAWWFRLLEGYPRKLLGKRISTYA